MEERSAGYVVVRVENAFDCRVPEICEYREAEVENSSATAGQKQESAEDSKSSISKPQINPSAVASTNVTTISIGESGKNILDGAKDVGKGLFKSGKGAAKSISDGFKSLW